MGRKSRKTTRPPANAKKAKLSNSSNVITQQFTIRVTDFLKNQPHLTEEFCSNEISSKILRSSTKTTRKQNSSNTSDIKAYPPGKKKIKMSEEIPTKRVILVLPNNSSQTPENNADKKSDDEIIYVKTKKDSEESIIKTNSNQLTATNTSNEMIESNKFKSDPITNTSIDENCEEISLIEDLSMSNGNHKENTEINNSIIPPRITIENSPEKINTCQKSTLKRSTPEIKRCSTIVMKTTELNKSGMNQSQKTTENLKQENVTYKPFPSTSKQQSPAVSRESLNMDKNNSIFVSPSPLIKTYSRKNIKDSSPQFRQIKISGLKLQPINSKVLNNLELENKIKLCNRPQRNESLSKNTTLQLSTGNSESLVTTTTVEPPHEMERININCEECAQLRKEVIEHRETIMDLKRQLSNSRTPSDINNHSDITIIKKAVNNMNSRDWKEMCEMNDFLSKDLEFARKFNERLKTGILRREKQVNELQSVLDCHARIFAEIGKSANTLKKLVDDSVRMK